MSDETVVKDKELPAVEIKGVLTNETLTTEEAKLFINVYVESLDETEAALRVLTTRNPDLKLDDRIAAILGRHMLAEKKIAKKINEALLAKKITPAQLKVDVYKLSKADDTFGKGRTKLGALSQLGKWLGMEQPTVNNFNMNLSWASLVEMESKKSRMSQMETGSNDALPETISGPTGN